MYSNIGGKIKILAIILAVISAAVCVYYGASLLEMNNQFKAVGINLNPGWFVLIGGPILSWTGSFTMFGFGVLIETTQAIHELLRLQQETPSPYSVRINPAKDHGYAGSVDM